MRNEAEKWYTMRRDARKRVLIVKFGAIGDVIMAVPAARGLHERGFEILWAAGRAVEPLLLCYSWISVIPVNDSAILRGAPLERLVNVLCLWTKVMPRWYELCAILYYDRRYRMLMAPVWARRKIKLSWHERQARLLPGRHHTDEYLRLLLDVEDGCKERSAVPIRPDLLPCSPLPEKRYARRIAIAPGGASNLLREQTLRRWPIEKYVALAVLFIERGWEVVLLGGPDDHWVEPYFSQLSLTTLVGTLTLPEVVTTCDVCDAVVTHDAGPLHLAGLSATCLIGIFGPVDPHTRLPRRPYAAGLWGGREFACRPCYDGRDFPPCQYNGCMHQVTPADVLQELDRLLDARDAGVIIPWYVVELPSRARTHTDDREDDPEVLV